MSKVLERADITIEEIEAAQALFDKMIKAHHPCLNLFFISNSANIAFMKDASAGLERLAAFHKPKRVRHE